MAENSRLRIKTFLWGERQFLCSAWSSSAPLEKPIMFPVPKSRVLGKALDFFGVISKSNKKLEEDAKEHSDNYDIEVLSGQQSEYIEMDLMPGVADLHTPEAVAAGHPLAVPFSQGSSESESEDEYEEYDESGSKSAKSSKFVPRMSEARLHAKKSREKKRKRRPSIVGLS